jgi:hypothetical protein
MLNSKGLLRNFLGTPDIPQVPEFDRNQTILMNQLNFKQQKMGKSLKSFRYGRKMALVATHQINLFLI